MTKEERMEAWLASKPKNVQELAKRFPPGSVLDFDGEKNWLLGYTENDELIITDIDPRIDYEAAVEQRKRICSSCIEEIEEITNDKQI